ncbi:MAG TPA: T9SS type A sorting domain-containing protein, partial [Flavobacteriales bacterium]|nr:T9SS type A sorting domain-containing protein [Flavobacteriales bacterium]
NDLSPCGSFTLDLAEESGIGSSITIFPNPAKDMLTIKSVKSLKNVQYGIYDLLGKTIKKGYLPLSGKLDIYEIPKGIFILKVEDLKHSYHQKFIKM